jgi:hypothetical protein
MSARPPRSQLTSKEAGRPHRRVRPRLQLEFSSARRRHRAVPGEVVRVQSVADHDGPTEQPASESERRADRSYDIEVFFKAVSDAVAKEGMLDLETSLDDKRERDVGLEGQIAEALDQDLAAALGQAKQMQSAQHQSVLRMLKAWTRKSDNSRKVFISHVLDTTLDPLTWRMAREDVGPRPAVSVVLLVPGSYADATRTKALEDIDVALVYRGGRRAAEEIEDLATAMTPDVQIPTPPVVLQARRNAEARAGLLKEFGALTATQVAELAGSEAKNTSALAGRWRREGRLIAVEHLGVTYYPGFQFDPNGRPKATVAEVLKHLKHPSMTPWQQALWFTTANGWLDGHRPVDALDEEGKAVIAAAREALREPVG